MPDTKQCTPTIMSIRWWNTYMLIDCVGTGGCLLRSDDGSEYVFKTGAPVGLADDADFYLNIAAVGGRRLLSPTTYVLCSIDGFPLLPVDALLECISDSVRSFLYRKGTRQYLVQPFVPVDDERHPYICIRVSHFREDLHPVRDFSAVRFAKHCMNRFYRIASAFYRHQGNRILFLSENNDNLSGNLAAVYNRLCARDDMACCRIQVICRDVLSKKTSLASWLSTLCAIARADIVFVEDYVPIFAAINLSAKTRLIQLWHAGFGFKAVGFGRFGRSDGSPNPFASCHRKYSYGIVGNAALRDIYAEVYGIEPSALLACGMPRLDGFLDSSTIIKDTARVEAKYKECVGKRVVLFAPTYRGNSQVQAHYDFDRVDFEAAACFCRESDSVILFKMHRFIHDAVPIPSDCSDVLFDASSEDINVLFHRVDCLITDYSSCFYDYLLCNRPIIFYAFDEAYYAATRGIHRPLADIAPGPICHSFKEVIEQLNRVVSGVFVIPPAAELLIDRASECNGLASDRVIDAVILGEREPGVWLD